MDKIQVYTRKLSNEIRRSREYSNYQQCEAALLCVPGLKDKLDRMRRDTAAAYSGADGNDLISESDELSRKYESLLRIPEAAAYIRAETSLCRLLQRISAQLADEAGVRLPEG